MKIQAMKSQSRRSQATRAQSIKDLAMRAQSVKSRAIRHLAMRVQSVRGRVMISQAVRADRTEAEEISYNDSPFLSTSECLLILMVMWGYIISFAVSVLRRSRLSRLLWTFRLQQ